jgi:hypothetical protein
MCGLALLSRRKAMVNAKELLVNLKRDETGVYIKGSGLEMQRTILAGQGGIHVADTVFSPTICMFG